MLERRRVPGALLFAGEDGVGKKLFAVALGCALNCRTPAGGEACGECPSCRRIQRFTLPAPDDTDANKQILWSEHKDVGLVRPAGRLIRVEQIRELERETNFRPFEGSARLFIIEEADRMNPQAANALLKTLEEPHPTAHLVLLTSRPASLLPTIRSRCQVIRFAPLAVREIEEYLIRERRRGGAEARLAAHLARGRLGYALDFNVELYREQREQMLGVLDALGRSRDRAQLLRAAEDLSDAKHKESYEPRLDILETLVHDLWLMTLDADGERLVNEDIGERLAPLSRQVKSRRAARWLSQIETLRGQLAVNINRRVATDALFLAMAEEGT